MAWIFKPWQHWANKPALASPAEVADEYDVRLEKSSPGTIRLTDEVMRGAGIRTLTVQPSAARQTLELSGTLILDANQLSRVHPRFAGEVVKIRKNNGRALDVGDAVHEGDVLAVVWSRDMGEKKSDLVDALSQLRLDRETLRRLTQTSAEGAIPERTIREAERRVESDEIAVARAIRTLETWRVPEEEIQALRNQAQALADARAADGGATTAVALPGKDLRREERIRDWAQFEVKAMLDGVILERNAVVGDLVDPSQDLFKIADFRRLRVVAHAYEENLPELDRLPDNQRHWQIRVEADPEMPPQAGHFDQIGRIIDPNQHTALVMGWVDNQHGRLRVGQFVTARLELPPPHAEVAIPATALLEIGDRQLVFVQADEKEPCFTQRRVLVSRRNGSEVLVRAELSLAERQRGLEPLQPGQRVIHVGVVPLAAKLSELERTAKIGS